MEYIAVFFAVLFPGALVAFNQDLLQSLPRFAVLRVYCAGIWHNAAVRSSLNMATKCLCAIVSVKFLTELYFQLMLISCSFFSSVVQSVECCYFSCP